MDFGLIHGSAYTLATTLSALVYGLITNINAILCPHHKVYKDIFIFRTLICSVLTGSEKLWCV